MLKIKEIPLQKTITVHADELGKIIELPNPSESAQHFISASLGDTAYPYRSPWASYGESVRQSRFRSTPPNPFQFHMPPLLSNLRAVRSW